jgi:transcriptional regulator with XRE-family HTH domain
MQGLPTFGELLRHYRQDRKLTQRELAEKIDVSSNYVALLEAGRRQNPSRKFVESAASALELQSRASNDLLIAAGYGVSHGTSTGSPPTHPVQRAVKTFLELSPGSPRMPTALKEVVQTLLGAATQRRAARQDKTVIRAAQLIGMGYFHKSTGGKNAAAGTSTTHQARQRRLEEGLFSLLTLLADTTLPIDQRIKLIDELVSLAAWKTGKPRQPVAARVHRKSPRQRIR